MALTPKYGNFGIVLSKNGTASGTYTDISGTTQANTALTTSYTAQGDAAVGGRYFSIVYGGSGSALSLFVDVGLSVATDVKVKVQKAFVAATEHRQRAVAGGGGDSGGRH